MTNQESFPLNRIRWACRRGMLELDIILLPFFEKRFSQLSKTQQSCFVRLLEHSDPDIYAWLMCAQEPTDPTLTEIIDLIRQDVKKLS